jgi:hypothetical protein
MIVAKAMSAMTHTGKQIKLDQALRVVTRLRQKNQTNEVIVAWCNLIGSYLKQAHDMLL